MNGVCEILKMLRLKRWLLIGVLSLVFSSANAWVIDMIYGINNCGPTFSTLTISYSFNGGALKPMTWSLYSFGYRSTIVEAAPWKLTGNNTLRLVATAT